MCVYYSKVQDHSIKCSAVQYGILQCRIFEYPTIMPFLNPRVPCSTHNETKCTSIQESKLYNMVRLIIVSFVGWKSVFWNKDIRWNTHVQRMPNCRIIDGTCIYHWLIVNYQTCVSSLTPIKGRQSGSRMRGLLRGGDVKDMVVYSYI